MKRLTFMDRMHLDGIARREREALAELEDTARMLNEVFRYGRAYWSHRKRLREAIEALDAVRAEKDAS